MSVTDDWRKIRDRLRNPPNAIPDTPIDLTRKSTAYRGDTPPPDTPPKKKLVPDVNHPVLRPPFRFDDILNEVCLFYNISKTGVLSGIRRMEYVMIRRITVYLSLKLIQRKSVASIAKDLNKDHTTILHARDMIMEMVQKDPELLSEINLIEEKLVVSHSLGLTIPSVSECALPEPPGESSPVQKVPEMDYRFIWTLAGPERIE